MSMVCPCVVLLYNQLVAIPPAEGRVILLVPTYSGHFTSSDTLVCILLTEISLITIEFVVRLSNYMLSRL